jgi:hypothetical protein
MHLSDGEAPDLDSNDTYDCYSVMFLYERQETAVTGTFESSRIQLGTKVKEN